MCEIIAHASKRAAPVLNQELQNAGLGGTVYLCRDAIYKIKSAVGFNATPKGSRAWIDIDDPSLATAVSAHDIPGAWLLSVAISGSEELHGHHSGNQAVIDFGGWNTTYNGRSQKRQRRRLQWRRRVEQRHRTFRP